MFDDREYFEQAVRRLAALVEAGVVPVDFHAAGEEVMVALDAEAAAGRLEAELGRGHVSRGQFELLCDDVDEILGYHLGGVSAEGYLADADADAEAVEDYDEDEGEDDDLRVTDPELATWRYRLVGEVFPLARLRRRAWLKSNSKTPVLHRLRWETALKTRDDARGAPADSAVAFGRVTVSGVSTASEGLMTPPVEVSLTVDLEDVEYMLDALARLRDALREHPDQDRGR